MPIKIIKKITSSNEIETLPEKLESATELPPIKKAYAPLPLVPFIDKISIIANIPEGESHQIHKNICLELDNAVMFKQGKKYGKFKIAKRVALGSVFNSKKWPMLQYRSEYDKAVQLRLEFSPVDLGKLGLAELHGVLFPMVPGGWPFIIQYGHVTGIEVTVDVPIVNINDFHVMPQQVATARSWSAEGRLQSLTLGKSRSNQTKLYNRAAKRKAQGQSSPHYEGTRIERRLKLNKSLQLSKLGALKNPFSGLQMVLTPPQRPPGEPKGYMWEMFTDSVVQRTLPVALKLLTAEKRTLYRTWLSQHPVSWWSPEEIWKHWPEYLAKTGISDVNKKW